MYTHTHVHTHTCTHTHTYTHTHTHSHSHTHIHTGDYAALTIDTDQYFHYSGAIGLAEERWVFKISFEGICLGYFVFSMGIFPGESWVTFPEESQLRQRSCLVRLDLTVMVDWALKINYLSKMFGLLWDTLLSQLLTFMFISFFQGFVIIISTPETATMTNTADATDRSSLPLVTVAAALG